ncbi:unnamed protein product [Blumeria hordei]|uniref:Uncharacterized protein n=1 Tax=Blumeria hordei TaxID=2867405 RepID=A0A383UP80_BLUHO|nr:unnamed protein product [Blumeria hordei]
MSDILVCCTPVTTDTATWTSDCRSGKKRESMYQRRHSTLRSAAAHDASSPIKSPRFTREAPIIAELDDTSHMFAKPQVDEYTMPHFVSNINWKPDPLQEEHCKEIISYFPSWPLSEEAIQETIRETPTKPRQDLVGDVVVEKLAAIEASNRELLSRVEAAEESTRILQAQNSSLQRKIVHFTRHYKSNSPPPNNRSRPCLSYSGTHTVPATRHRPSPSLSLPKTTFSSLSEPLPLEPILSRNQPRNSSRAKFASKSLPPNVNTRSQSPPLRPQQNAQHESATQAQPKRKVTNESPSAHHKTTTKINTAVSPTFHPSCMTPHSSPHVSPHDFHPLTSHSLSKISSPLPGSVQHHQISVQGLKMPNNTLKMISLEEARRRAYSLDLPDQGGLAPPASVNQTKNMMVEGEILKLWQDGLTRDVNDTEIPAEKKKNRLQDLFLGRKRLSRDER